MAAHVVKTIEFDWLEAIVEDFHNYFLREASKTEGEALNFLGDLTCNINLISQPPGTVTWRWVECESWGGSNYGGRNASVRFSLHAFEPEYMLLSSNSLFVLGFLAIDLKDLQVLLLSQACMNCVGRISWRGEVAWRYDRGKKEKAKGKEMLASWRLKLERIRACWSNKLIYKGWGC